MNSLAVISSLAEVGHPLFGNQWLALLAILAGIAVFMAAVAGVGQWLAATHPDPAARPTPVTAAPAPVDGTAPPEVLAVIAASVAVTLGARARVAAVIPIKTTPPLEQLQPWSVEGRRQIYSSHRIR
ncbi:MAG TPA: OadG family protein [Opitutaceae bacterium]|nr:OadG family protein [Opitutaceae bacterium]